MLQDLRYAIRLLLKNKTFTLVAVLSLAIGIGANTALFTVVDAALVRKLPVKDPDALVVFDSLSGPNIVLGNHSGYGGRDRATGLRRFSSFSLHSFNRMQPDQQVLSALFVFATQMLNVNVDDSSEMAFGQVVSGSYFAGLGIEAERGRLIGTADDNPAANPVAVISFEYWQRRFKSDPQVIGRTIKVNTVPFTVVGVTPRRFSGALQVGEPLDISIPLLLAPAAPDAGEANPPWRWWLRMMGRLKPGVTAEQARAALQPVFAESALDGWNAMPAERKARANPEIPRDTPLLRIASGSRGLNEEREDLGRLLGIFLALLGVVLLITCANVANLLLSRSAARRQEIAMRLALGANRARLIRQMLSESVVLALSGGVLGTALAYWSTSAIVAWAPWRRNDQFTLDLSLNMNVLAFMITLSAVTGILFGIMPALRTTRVDLTPAMKEGARNLSGKRTLVSKTLLVGQVALSVLLLITAGLFVRTLQNLHNIDIGFNSENLLIFSVGPRDNNYQTSQMASLYDDLLDRIRAVPGVRHATASNMTLLRGGSWQTGGYIRGVAPEPSTGQIYRLAVAPNFFDTLEIPLQLGRQLTEQDNSRNAPRVAVVNQTLARRFFADKNPIGNHIGFGPPGTAPELEIVGVVADAKYDRLRNNPMIVYSPYAQDINEVPRMTFEVRTSGDPNAFVPAVRDAVRQVDPNLPLIGIKTQEDQIAESVSFERLFATVAGSFGSLALILAGIGLYGILSYNVTRRTNEIGIRMALGAGRWDVVRIVVAETMMLAVSGIAMGMLLVLGAAWLLKMLFPPVDLSRDILRTSPTDPLTITIVVGMMLAVTALSSYLPARRASRIDPTVALRYE